MVTAGAGVDARRSAELAGDDQQYVLIDAAIDRVINEGANGVIDLRAEVLHGGGDAAVHVPTAEVDADEADAGFAQPSRQQELFAKAFAETVAHARVFALYVEGVTGLAKYEVESLGVEAVETLDGAASVNATIEIVKAFEQRSAVGQVVEGDLEVHVVLSAAAHVERGERGAEPGRTVAKSGAGAGIGGQAADRVVGAAKARDDGADAGLVLAAAVVGLREVVAGHNPVRAAAVAAVAVGERAHHGQLVGVLGHLRKDAAELDARQTSGDVADGAAELDGRVRLGVEGFDLRGAASEPEPDDRGIACGFSLRHGGGAGAKEVGQHKAAESERADFEEVAAAGAVAVGPVARPGQMEHGSILFHWPARNSLR